MDWEEWCEHEEGYPIEVIMKQPIWTPYIPMEITPASPIKSKSLYKSQKELITKIINGSNIINAQSRKGAGSYMIIDPKFLPTFLLPENV